jgi:hypothetical protein
MKRFFFIAVTITLALILNGCVQVQPYPPNNPPAPKPKPKPQKWINETFQLGTRNTIRVHVTGQSNNPKKYKICIRNSSGGKNKGLDWKENRKKPVFIARKQGSVVCGEYNPKFVDWNFYKFKNFKYRKVGSYGFDARAYAGKEITFDWLKD